LITGTAIAGVSLCAYAIARGIPAQIPDLAASLLAAKHGPDFVQVILEDIAIAAFLSRLSIVGGRWAAIGIVAALFAAAHIPAMMAKQTLGMSDWAGLVGDTTIGVLILGAVLSTRSIWWFMPVHFVMDMTQFMAVGGKP